MPLILQVKTDINKKLNERKKQLKSLGPCRETREQQHEYLLNLATRYHNATFLARAAHYGSDDIFDRIPDLKLATIVVDRNAIFADDIWKKGHTMKFDQWSESSEDSEDEAEELEDDEAEDDNAEDDNVEEEDDEDSDEQFYSVRHTEQEPELDDILHDDCKVPAVKPTGIILWLDRVYKSSRGFEMGTFDASILPNIWKKQSAKWDDLALGYVSDIVSHVHKFIVTLLSAICEDQRVQSALMLVLMDGLVECYKKSIDHAEFILHVEKLGTPLTANHYFADNLDK